MTPIDEPHPRETEESEEKDDAFSKTHQAFSTTATTVEVSMFKTLILVTN